MSEFSKRAMGYTIAIGVAGIAAEGINYWQGTPPSTGELRWLLFLLEVGAGVVATALTIDLARWLWRRAHRNSN